MSHYLITGVYVSTGDFTSLGMHQQLSFLQDASRENARVGTASLEILPAMQLARLLQGHGAHLPRAAAAKGSDPRPAGRRLYGVCALMHILPAASTSGPDDRHCWVAQATLHWMLRLRYCRNMLASWGRFSSLGCILV